MADIQTRTGVSTEAGLARLNKDELRQPIVDRSLQFGYAPGSTMKVVTLTAALDTGQFSLQSQVSGDNGVKISGVPLQNDFKASRTGTSISRRR